MLLYLDLNCFNRPFDDQNQQRIASETAAVFSILQAVGVAALDAAHLASAEAGDCACLITCDDRFIRRARRTDTQVMMKNPLEFVESLKHD